MVHESNCKFEMRDRDTEIELSGNRKIQMVGIKFGDFSENCDAQSDQSVL